MAYLEARSGIARAGVTYGGFARPRFEIRVGDTPSAASGTDRTASILSEGFQIRRTLNAAVSMMSFQARGWTPTVGNRITVKFCTPNEYTFAGFIVRVLQEVQEGVETIWQCEAVSESWALDCWRPYGTVIYPQGIASALRLLLAEVSTTPAFRVGYVDADLGNVAETRCDGFRTVSDIIGDWVGQCAEPAWWRIREDRTIDVFALSAGIPDTNALALSDTSTISEVVEQQDLAQVATRVFVLGPSSITSQVVAAGSSTIDVEDGSPFYPTQPGGDAVVYVLVEGRLYRYGGTYPTTGVAQITLTGGETTDIAIPQGTEVRHVSMYESTGGESALLTATSSWVDIADRWADDVPSGTAEGSMQRAIGMVLASDAKTSVVSYRTRERWVQVGQQVTSTATAFSGTYVVSQVDTVAHGTLPGQTSPRLWHSVVLEQVDRLAYRMSSVLGRPGPSMSKMSGRLYAKQSGVKVYEKQSRSIPTSSFHPFLVKASRVIKVP